MLAYLRNVRGAGMLFPLECLFTNAEVRAFLEHGDLWIPREEFGVSLQTELETCLTCATYEVNTF